MNNDSSQSENLEIVPTLSIETYKPLGLKEHQEEISQKYFNPRSSKTPESSDI